MNNLKEFFDSQEEFIRLKELNNYFKKNQELYKKIEQMKELQKDIIHAKHNNSDDEFELTIKYKNLIKDIIDIPFVEEYFDLLNLFYNTLEIVKESFEISLI